MTEIATLFVVLSTGTLIVHHVSLMYDVRPAQVFIHKYCLCVAIKMVYIVAL